MSSKAGRPKSQVASVKITIVLDAKTKEALTLLMQSGRFLSISEIVRRGINLALNEKI